MKKLVSLYVKGGDNDAGYYYRFHQYFRELSVLVRKHQMYSDRVYKKYLPASKNPLFIIGLLWLYSTIRVFVQLVYDNLNKPDFVIVSRRLVSRKTLYIHRQLLKSLHKRGTRIIWDMDDNIRASRECDLQLFNLLCKISSRIIIASPYLLSIFPNEVKEKVCYMPSVDGEIERSFSEDLISNRLNNYNKEIRVLWLGTQVSLPFVNAIIPRMEEAAKEIKSIGKELSLIIVSDKKLYVNNSVLNVNNITWSRQVAMDEIKKAHIGIMPLEINEFAKGKGAFKLLQYISMGLPVVATGVGLNNEVVSDDVGYLANSFRDDIWRSSVIALSTNESLYKEYSTNARRRYTLNYSYDKNLNFWNNILDS